MGEKWRKCMGIEPTSSTCYAPLDGFEDRGHHQAYKHFRLGAMPGSIEEGIGLITPIPGRFRV